MTLVSRPRLSYVHERGTHRSALANGGDLDALETYLGSAAILDVSAFSQTTAHHSFRLILEGGVGVIAKPVDTAPEGEITCRREAVAWTVARMLGWPDLLGATVMRTMTSPASGEEVATSVQVLWPDYLPDADIALFSDEDVWRAAVFDAIVGHSDRGGHNWLAVPGSSQSPCLKLVDHGHAFPENTNPPSSTFYTERAGNDIPEPILNTLDAARRSFDGLRPSLSDEAIDAVVARTDVLLGSAVLEIFAP